MRWAGPKLGLFLSGTLWEGHSFEERGRTSRSLFADLRRMPKIGHDRPEMRFCGVF